MTLRIIAFGAHPDDCELAAGGVAAKWAAAGHKVKFVATTNGDVGHFATAGGPLALRRMSEVKRCAELLGITTQVLDIHDGELMPTLENRRTIARLIRDWQADVVLCHRNNDYHPDHRYTGILVEDAAVLVCAPFFVPDTLPCTKNPVFLYYGDDFQKPCPFEPHIVVGTDEVIDKKRGCIELMPSQFADKDSWLGRYLPGVPDDDEGRKNYIREWLIDRGAAAANKYRAQLVARYGEAQGNAIKYAEAFEVCQYGAQPTAAELNELFPR
ncbi:MAG: PIG-L family deacetylase [Acidobacteria bacterium]|nr:PIG-L family deacetylase [Acidobacteriota bacterium]